MPVVAETEIRQPSCGDPQAGLPHLWGAFVGVGGVTFFAKQQEFAAVRAMAATGFLDRFISRRRFHRTVRRQVALVAAMTNTQAQCASASAQAASGTLPRRWPLNLMAKRAN